MYRLLPFLVSADAVPPPKQPPSMAKITNHTMFVAFYSMEHGVSMKISDNWILQTIWRPEIKKSIEFEQLWPYGFLNVDSSEAADSNDCNSVLISFPWQLHREKKTHFGNVQFSISILYHHSSSSSLQANFANLPFNKNRLLDSTRNIPSELPKIAQHWTWSTQNDGRARQQRKQ